MVWFELTDEQREIRDWVHSFAENEIRPVADQSEAAKKFPRAGVEAPRSACRDRLPPANLRRRHGIMPALVAGS
jgi:alkylation response protein AidB-like acyl-CoA dehydrogenase